MHEDRLVRRPAHWHKDRKYFFKYMNAQTAGIVLRNRSLRWSRPDTLNDPYDVQFDLHRDGIDREPVKAVALEKSWHAHYGPEAECAR